MDESHGIEGSTVSIVPQAVDRDNSGMLEFTGDLGLGHKPRPAPLVVCVRILDLLEGDGAVELGVEGHRDLSQASPGMRPQDPEPKARRCRFPDAEGLGTRRIDVCLRLCARPQSWAGWP